MMQAIFDMFDERVQEIDLYFEALKELDQGNTEHLGISHYFDNDQPPSIRTENSVIIGLGAGIRFDF